MKKINVKAIRNDEYIIEFDETIHDKAKLKRWSKVFVSVNSLNELAENLAFQILRNGTGNFYEGFGHVKTIGAYGCEMNQWQNFQLVKSDEYAPGILVTIVNEGDDYDFETEVIDG